MYSALVKSRRITQARLYSPFKLVDGATRTNEQGVSFTFRGLIQPRVSEHYRNMWDIALCCRAARIAFTL